MRQIVSRAFCAFVLAALAAGPLSAQDRTHVLIVVGLGGTDAFSEDFHGEASQIYTALVEQHRVPAEDVVYLGEDPRVAPDMISEASTRANVLRVLGEMSQRVGPNDRVLVVLIGHGADGANGPQFNLSGPDLGPSDFELASAAFPSQTLALVHTGSASGGFVPPLSGPNRILITATRSGRESNATEFGQFFADALAGAGSDLDHDNRISLLEAFTYATQEVARHYEEGNEMQSEHAVLDDDGDGQGSPEASLDGPDGRLAATFTLGFGFAVDGRTVDDPVLARLLRERDDLQRQIDGLRALRSTLSEEEFLDRMEPLLIDLALVTREIEAAGDGGAAVPDTVR